MKTCKHRWEHHLGFICERCGITCEDFHDLVRYEVRGLEREGARQMRIIARVAKELLGAGSAEARIMRTLALIEAVSGPRGGR